MGSSRKSSGLFLLSLLVLSIAAACGGRNTVSGSDGKVEILTEQNDFGMDALGSFTLQYDSEMRCLYHDEPDNNGEPGTGGRVVIVWPDGYSAMLNDNGVAVVSNAAGEVVASEGRTFSIGGGAVPDGEDHCDAIGVWIANGEPIR